MPMLTAALFFTLGIVVVDIIREDEGDVQDILDAIRQREKVCIFVDNSNLFHALRGFTDRKMDYLGLRDFLADGRGADIRFYYSVLLEATDEASLKRNKFYDFLERVGRYQMIPLPLKEKFSGNSHTYEEKGLDCEIVYDMARLATIGHYQTFILVAGDEDYARTVKRLRMETGISVEVAFFGNFGCSSALRKEASDFIDLSKANELFLDSEDETYKRE